LSESNGGNTVENVIIIGSGPAGYTAALYTARADLQPLVIEGWAWGGLLQQTTDVENYPGFPDGVMGPEMMQRFRDQAVRFGGEERFITDEVTKVELSKDGGAHRVWVGDKEYRAKALVLSMGAEPKKLGISGEDELAVGRGVSYCATCDAAFYKDKPTIVVGGGDTAMEEAIFLAKFSSKVVVVHRRNEFRASAIMVDRARQVENLEFKTPFEPVHFEASEAGPLESVLLRNTETAEEETLAIQGAFIGIGHQPNSALVAGQVELDENGFVVTEGKSTRTGVPGVFAAGDLVDHIYRQAITAAGSGCQAALDAEWYLRDRAPNPADHWFAEDAYEHHEAQAPQPAN
jgi:thioredoxin reductase (NADPH)